MESSRGVTLDLLLIHLALLPIDHLLHLLGLLVGFDEPPGAHSLGIAVDCQLHTFPLGDRGSGYAGAPVRGRGGMKFSRLKQVWGRQTSEKGRFF